MSQNAERDFISSLPPELLSEIFNYAYKDSEPPRTPISRAFLPFQRQALFRQIRIDSLSHFDRLVEAHESNAGLGKMVRTLELKDVDVQGGGGGTKNERRMKGFFSTLVNLEHLTLGFKSTSLIDLVLSLRIARSELRQLRSLSLKVPSEWKKPFDSKIYRYLNDYPSLDCLKLTFNVENGTLAKTKRGMKLTKIRELVLKGPYVDSPATLEFLENFPNLSSLTIDVSYSPEPDYPLLARSLPKNLTSLTFRSLGFYEDYSAPVDEHLPRLVNLEHLYLSEGSFSQDVINSLRQLPKLKTLGFGKGALLSCARLEEIILGPNRVPTLEKVIFDQVEGRVGWRIHTDSDGYTLHPDWKESNWHGGPGWIIPQWLPFRGGRFDEDQVKSLVDRIKLSAVQIEGTTIEAFGVFDQWTFEMCSCATARAYMLNDFDECRELFGDEFVNEELLGFY
ncbi:hypothetical protein JCM5350_007899 [Sporobolomyces pararoseus]